uniref:BZIP domain-containing protein n=1 Tax=Steinernema glaseri TaxID=37863 RepID=A0A1I7Y2E5_9BILA
MFFVGYGSSDGGEEARENRVRKRAKAAEQLQLEERRYARKIMQLMREIKATVYTNAAMVDEVSRLNIAIVKAEAENKMIIRRLRTHERNRIRRIKNQQNREIAQAAALAKRQPSPSSEPLAENSPN